MIEPRDEAAEAQAHASAQGSSAASWNAMPRWCSRWVSPVDIPLISAVPDVGSSSPARIRRTVDFPQPDGPSSDRNVPCAVPRSVGASAWTWLRPSVNVLLRPCRFSPVAAWGAATGSRVASRRAGGADGGGSTPASCARASTDGVTGQPLTIRLGSAA